MIKKIFHSFIHKNASKFESDERTKATKESEDSVDASVDEHNQCFIGDHLNDSTCTNEPNYNWCKMSHEDDLIKKTNSIKESKSIKMNNKEMNNKNCMMECFTDDGMMNVSSISRRRILANIDYDVDGQFMCSTLIKDANDDKNELKQKFHHQNESTGEKESKRLSNQKLELISKQMQEAEIIKHQINGKFYRKDSTIDNRMSKGTSQRSNNRVKKVADEEPIYDSNKPFSDLSSIEEARLDNLRNNLKNMQMNSIDKRRALSKHSNENYKIDRSSLIEHENLRSEMYNNENSNFINQIKKIHNYHNNQIVHDLNDETWVCKTKLYDDTLDEIVRKWTSLDSEIWCKIILFERNRRVAKAYIRLPYLIVSSGKGEGFDGYSISVNCFENIYRDQETDFIVKNLDKGVRIIYDEDGNLILRKMTHLSVQIKDWLQQLTEGAGSLSDEVIALHGKIPFNQPIKVFDIDRFASNLRQELEKPVPNRRRLAKQAILAVSFGKVTYNVLNSPSWLMIVNLHALRMIERTTLTRSIPVSLPEPDYGLSTIENNLNQVCLKDESSGSSSCSTGSDSLHSNSEEDQYYGSGFTSNKNIYSSI